MATRKKAKQYGDGEMNIEDLISGVQGTLSGGRRTGKPQVRGVSAPKIASGEGRSRSGSFSAPPVSLLGKAPNEVQGRLGSLRSEGYQGNGGIIEALFPLKGVEGKTGSRISGGPKVQTPIKNPAARPGPGIGLAKNFASLFKSGMSTLAGMQQKGQDITEPLAMFTKSLDDYIREAGDGSELVSGQLAALDAEGSRMKSRAGEGDEKIRQIYDQLAASMGQEGENASARYADASKQMQSATDSASGAIKAARANAELGQSEIAENLGITDRAPSVAQENQAADGAAGLSGIQVNGLSGRGLLDTLGNAQADYFKGNQAASQFRGAEARTALERDLQDRLGALSMDRASTLDGARQQALQIAQQRYAADRDQFESNRNYADSVDDRAYSRGQDRYRLEQDYSLQQQQIRADQQAMEAELAAKQGEENRPATFLQIQQQLAQAMPATSASKAVEAMSRFKIDGGAKNGGNIANYLRDAGITDPKEIALALGYAQEFLNEYKY